MYKYKRRRCRYCGKWYTAKPPFYTKRIGGRQSLYCSDTCRKLWRKEYKHNWGQENRDRILKQKKEYYLERHPNAYLVDPKRTNDMVQRVYNLELYPQQLKHKQYNVTFLGFPKKVDEEKIQQKLKQIKDLHLDTEYLENNESFDYSLINLRTKTP